MNKTVSSKSINVDKTTQRNMYVKILMFTYPIQKENTHESHLMKILYDVECFSYAYYFSGRLYTVSLVSWFLC